MRSDQADNLRRLVSLRSDQLVGGTRNQSRLTVLSGCKGGQGVTTLALNLAVAMRRLASRVLLIDCNPLRGDLAPLYRLRGHDDIENVLQGSCSLQEAIIAGPGGVQIVPKFGLQDSSTPARCWQLLRCLDEVSMEYDHIIIDAGACLLQAETLFPAAHNRIVLTTLDQVALTDSYHFIKTLHARGLNQNPLSVVCNRYYDAAQAVQAERRIMDSCNRFLDLDLKRLCGIPFDELWERAVRESRSVLCMNAKSPSALALEDLAHRLTSLDLVNNGLNPVGSA